MHAIKHFEENGDEQETLRQAAQQEPRGLPTHNRKLCQCLVSDQLQSMTNSKCENMLALK